MLSWYGDKTHRRNLDCVSQLEIGQTVYLLIHPRTMAQLGVFFNSTLKASFFVSSQYKVI